jgi:isoleucyl-tRNA synthetase
MSSTIESYVNAKRVDVKKSDGGGRKEVKPLFAKLGPAFKQHAKIIADELTKVDGDAVGAEIDKTGRYLLHTNAGTFDILPEHIAITEKKSEDDATRFRYGVVTIDATQTDELRAELMYREVTRRVQMMRKDAGLTRLDSISLSISAEPDVVALLKTMEKQIAEAVKATKIEIGSGSTGDGQKEWEIMGVKIGISIRATGQHIK